MGSIGKFLTCLCECRDFIWCALMKHFLEGSRYTLFIDCFGMLTQRRIFVTLLILTNVPISQRSNFFEEIFQDLPSKKFKLDPWKDYWNIYSCKIIFFPDQTRYILGFVFPVRFLNITERLFQIQKESKNFKIADTLSNLTTYLPISISNCIQCLHFFRICSLPIIQF